MCHQILLVGKGGRSVFLGSQSEALEYFKAIGFPCPSYYNPADFFMELMAGRVTRLKEGDLIISVLFLK